MRRRSITVTWSDLMHLRRFGIFVAVCGCETSLSAKPQSYLKLPKSGQCAAAAGAYWHAVRRARVPPAECRSQCGRR